MLDKFSIGSYELSGDPIWKTMDKWRRSFKKSLLYKSIEEDKKSPKSLGEIWDKAVQVSAKWDPAPPKEPPVKSKLPTKRRLR